MDLTLSFFFASQHKIIKKIKIKNAFSADVKKYIALAKILSIYIYFFSKRNFYYMFLFFLDILNFFGRTFFTFIRRKYSFFFHRFQFLYKKRANYLIKIYLMALIVR